jgi:hypothetical protein
LIAELFGIKGMAAFVVCHERTTFSAAEQKTQKANEVLFVKYLRKQVETLASTGGNTVVTCPESGITLAD